MSKSWLHHILPFLLGGTFIISGIGKIVNTTAFANVMMQYGVDYLSLLAPAIAILEVYLGVSVILRFKLRFHALGILLLTLGFSVIYTYGLITKGIEDCHCFGSFSLSFLEVPLGFYIKNFVILILAAFVWRFPVTKPLLKKNIQAIIMISILLGSSFYAGYTFSIPHQLVIEQSGQYMMTKKRADLLLECYPFDCDSTYVVFVFSYKCPYCINSLEHIKAFEKKEIVDKAVFIGYGFPSMMNEFIADYDLQSGIKEMKAEWIHQMVDIFPTTFFIKGCKPIYASKGYVEAPSLYLMRHKQLQDNLSPSVEMNNVK